MVGLSRKTLYLHIKQGKLSVHIGEDGGKYIETSELMRCYRQVVLPETNDLPTLLRQLIDEIKELKELTKNQSEELSDIKQELKSRPLLEHQPKAIIEPALEESAPAKEDEPEPAFKSIIKRMKEKQKSQS